MKERYQNLVCGDTIRLRLYTFNSNEKKDVNSIESVTIYYHDPLEITTENPQGLRLIATIESNDIVHDSDGSYYVDIITTPLNYLIGDYTDTWKVQFEDGECFSESIKNTFKIIPDSWYASEIDLPESYQIFFRPNRFIKGTKRNLICEIIPNVPKASDLEKYYKILNATGEIRISIAAICGPCLPAEKDLRLVVDREIITNKQGCNFYYFLDTEEMNIGIYDVWFEINIGENTFITESNQIQIA